MASYKPKERAHRSTPDAGTTQAVRELLETDDPKRTNDIGPSGLQLMPRGLARRIATLVVRKAQ